MVPRALPASSQQAIGVVVAVAVAVVWFLANRHYYSELIAVRRDPSIYTLRGFWLMNHSSADVALTQQLLDMRRQVPGLQLDFGGETGQLIRYFQSTTVVPGLIAVGGWFGGPSLLFQANLMIGAAVLVIMYAVTRRLAGPWLGLIPTVALALCMPMAAFSRVAYTEPISMLVILVGMLALTAAWRENRPLLWLLAGIGIGAACLCRVDGALAIAGAAVGFGALAGFAPQVESRRKALFGYLWFLAGAVPMYLLGWTDLKFHSPHYLYALRDEFGLLRIATLGVVLFAFLLGVLPLTGVGRWLARHRVGLARLLGGCTAALLVLLCLRPLFSAPRSLAGGYASGVANRQRAEGLAIDGARNYSEQTVNWLSWYFGWPLVISAGIAVVVIVWVIARRGNATLLLVFSVSAVNAMLYLNSANINPDQIWAMRRFLPIIIPGMLLAFAWGASELTRGARRRYPTARWLRSVVMPVIVLAMLVPAGTVWGQMFPIPEGAGQYDMVTTSCAAVAPDNKVLILGSLPTMGNYQPTYRNICGSQVLAYVNRDEKRRVSPVPAATVAQIAQLWGGTVTVVTFHPDQVAWTEKPTVPLAADSYQMWESPLSHPTARPRDESTEIYMGIVQLDGRVAPITS
jgi:4-amino-4-deoxy-L-arabinose transferase-like glycosyltransferase